MITAFVLPLEALRGEEPGDPPPPAWYFDCFCNHSTVIFDRRHIESVLADLKAERDDAGESRLPHLGFLRVVRVDQDRRDLGTNLPRRRSCGWLGQRFPTTSDPTPDGWPNRLSSSE